LVEYFKLKNYAKTLFVSLRVRNLTVYDYMKSFHLITTPSCCEISECNCVLWTVHVVFTLSLYM